MLRWGLLGLIISYMGVEEYALAHAFSSVVILEEGSFHQIKSRKKKKSRKSKKNKSRKHKSKKHKFKGKVYSAQKIEKLLENDHDEDVCNRLNCASNLEIAKSCLPTKASHRTEKKCFRAFCAYGCNEEDYKTKPEVYDFCNLKCSSKKYSKRTKPRAKD